MKCELCGSLVKVVGETTKHYEPLNEGEIIIELIHQRSIAFDKVAELEKEIDRLNKILLEGDFGVKEL